MSKIPIQIVVHSRDCDRLDHPIPDFQDLSLSITWIVEPVSLHASEHTAWLGICVANGYLILITDVVSAFDIEIAIESELDFLAFDYPFALKSFEGKPVWARCDTAPVEIVKRFQQAKELCQCEYESLDLLESELSILNEYREISLDGSRFTPDDAMYGVLEELHQEYEAYVSSTNVFRRLLDKVTGKAPWLCHPLD